jgi:hypothetical protein
MMFHKYHRRVNRGIAVLDKHGPANWRSMVEPDSLNVGSCSFCPLGQIYGSYQEGINRLGIGDPVHYGFHDPDCNWNKLTNIWKEKIRMGDIGEIQKEVIFEPIPETTPITEPTPAPAPVKEPEKVPA